MSKEKKSLLSLRLLDMDMPSPVLAASGTFGFGREFRDLADVSRLGGVMVKGTTLKPRSGNKGIRIAETPAGMLNSIGLENPGVDVFLRDILPQITGKMNVIVNISGSSPEEYGELAARLDVAGVNALELNVSCPNVKDGGIIFGTDPESLRKVVRITKDSTKKPIIVKLSPNVTDIALLAKVAEEAGADALSLINTLLGMAIDVKSRRPVLGNITGGLSGPAVKPVALRMVWQVSQAVKIPLIGMGGISSATDALEFILAGATAVAVGTANFIDPTITDKIIADLDQFAQSEHLNNIADIVGSLQI